VRPEKYLTAFIVGTRRSKKMRKKGLNYFTLGRTRFGPDFIWRKPRFDLVLTGVHNEA
jgi:hypothetical protein